MNYQTVRDIKYAISTDDLYEVDEIIDGYRQDHYTGEIDFYTQYLPQRGEYAICVQCMKTDRQIGWIGGAV